MTYELFHWTEDISKDWDLFVSINPKGSIHQMSCWKKFQETIPGRGNVQGYGMKDKKGNIVATCFCVRMSTGFNDTYWHYSARGPVVDPKDNPSLVKKLLSSIQEELSKKTKSLFWRIDPYFSIKEYENLEDIDFTTATQDYQPTDTLVLDLTKDNETLLSEMKRKGRYNIKQAQKHNIIIRAIETKKINEEDLSIFWKLNKDTTSRDGFSGHSKEYYENFIKLLAPHATLFIAEKDGLALATAINTHCGDKAIYYFGASTSNHEDRKLMAPYLLQWEMIQYARAQGCKTYDFLGIAPENKPKHAYAGISDFKWKFGGNRQTYSSGKEFIFRKGWYKLYKIAKRFKK